MDTPDAALPVSPDVSLAQRSGIDATHHRGLVYPFGGQGPATGEAIAIGDAVHWLRLPLPGSLGHINCWLIADGTRTSVVDTGLNTPACADAWRMLFDAAPLADRPIGRVICTHFHPDHVGMAGWLARKFDARLWMTRGEWLTVRLLTSDMRDEVPEEQRAFWRAAGWSEAQIEAAAAGGFARMARAVAPLPMSYRRITDGERIAIGGREWLVVIGSGHCPEHACLLNAADGLLISGDQVLPRISSNVSLGLIEPEADPLGEWLASIERLLLLPDDLLVLPSHGDPFVGLHLRLIALRDEHRMRLDQLHAHLAQPRRAVDCFGRMFRRKIEGDMLGLASGETLAHLRRLEVEGRAMREDRDGVWWYRAA
ncbi:MBL fold metallo-hydrolase [Sphingomonas turrisvirgatae]|uniref:MBL fold metallo-hydrolase n=1 Tax=Sphingomonas turrisvirgatae TaxID=1888892 RepID=A0A1E3LXN8_9SPHN|nr:MBL fold metallo-hydrolase [Sphingomonas turrisvirgatae]ODP38489.1 MBL fold metallo-hydrolase [Sphingomonas turrisvirgatae]